MTEYPDAFDRIGRDCLRQSHLPRGPFVPIILVPSQFGVARRHPHYGRSHLGWLSG
jgi:hypothetical protein